MRTCAAISILLSLILNSALQAQSFWLGAQAGCNVASASTSSDLKHTVSSHPGAIAGLVAEYALGGGFALRIEPSYVQKGAEVDAEWLGMTYNHQVRITSFDVPVLVQYRILTGSLRPVVSAGLNAGFNRKVDDSYAATKVGAVIVSNPKRVQQDLTDYCESLDILMEVGVGLEYAREEKTRFFLNARYSHGFSDQVKLGFFGFDGTWNTSDFRIQGGIMIPVW
jgi:hypothetical protein